MNNFNECLRDNEKIIWSGKPNPKKRGKDIAGEIFLIIFTIVVQAIMVFSVTHEIGDGKAGISLGFIIIFLAVTFFGVISIYSIISKLFLMNYKTKKDEYCITDKRVIVYKGRKKEIWYGNIINYYNIETNNVKKKYGDLILAVEYLDENEGLKTLGKNLINPDKTNLAFINLVSIENVKKVKDLVTKQRQELIKEKEIPTIDNIKI